MLFIVLKQTAVMAVYMVIGIILYRCGKITKEGGKTVASILLYAVVPVVIFNSFCTEFSQERLNGFLWSFVFAAIALFISNFAGALLFKNSIIDNMSVGYGNIGFMGIPLVSAAVGPEAVFYLAPYIMLFNLLQWNYTTSLLKGVKEPFSIKKVIKNQYTIASIAGFIVFVTGLGTRIPPIVRNAADQIAGVNSPLAMILLGSYASQSDFRKLFSSARVIWVSALRLVIIPIVTAPFFLIFPADGQIKTTLLIASAAPVATTVAVYAQLYEHDYSYASLCISFSTLVSILTLPLVAVFCTLLF